MPAHKEFMSMQQVLQALQAFWAAHGCIVLQPFNTEVGAGTANPSTLLRVLGPEPWNACYVEPSVRPDDSRYGENPNRLQTHTQFQVILKPEPANAQELYLASLRSIGVNTDSNDVRFVEDNWASPALGAWGLGWEVWLNGMEITQFTYFQQAAGASLEPVAVELTYGIERIMMALQGVAHFKDIKYSEAVSYGEIWGQSEYEMSRYYLDDADLDRSRALFGLYAEEADMLLDRRLPVPAYLSVLKCSHLFNVLDARGAVSPTERAGSFAQMRDLTRRAAELWLERREELGFPLAAARDVAELGAGPAKGPSLPSLAEAAEPDEVQPVPRAHEHVLLEIGVEELPHREVTSLAQQLARSMTSKLAATRLSTGTIKTFATPRRLAVLIQDVSDAETAHSVDVRGPKTRDAFDSNGSPTRALVGFAAKNGVEPAELSTITTAGGDVHVSYRRVDAGKTAQELLPGILRECLLELQPGKNMRWQGSDIGFSRPIRWLLALRGSQTIRFEAAGLVAGATTRGLRGGASEEVKVGGAELYESTLLEHGIVADPGKRRDMIIEQSATLASSVGGSVDVALNSDLLDEIVNLVEAPVAIMGSFEEKYLVLPDEVLLTVMTEHQRYLPVYTDGKLLPNFITVTNGRRDDTLVRAGNESVIRARFEDAAFFWRTDLSRTPEQWTQELDSLIFATQLGTMRERAGRISTLASALTGHVRAAPDVTRTVRRAGQLIRFDHVTGMVAEFSSLTGTMAKYYALASGESDEVSAALEESEWPKKAGGRLPATLPGALLSIADRADLLAGLCSLEIKSTSSSDQFGLRRAALGLGLVMSSQPALRQLDTDTAIRSAVKGYANQGIIVSETQVDMLLALVQSRLEQQLLEDGHDVRHIRACRPSAGRPYEFVQNVNFLYKNSPEDQLQELSVAVIRAANMLGSAADFAPAPANADNGYAHQLLAELQKLRLTLARSDAANQSLPNLVRGSSGLASALNEFLENVRVMDDDLELRNGNLSLLNSVVEFANSYADWTQF
ncbi:glycyl-tRNA synthetase [Arthrobacter sp. UYCu712]